MPLIVDATGVYVRPEGSVYIAGSTESEDGEQAADPADFEPDWSLFRGNDLADPRHPRPRLRGDQADPRLGRPLRL